MRFCALLLWMALTATAHAAEPPEGAASPPVYQIVTREEWRAATPDGHVQDVAVIQTPGYWGAGRSFSAQVFADGRYVFDGKRKTRHEGKQWMVLADPTIFGRLAAYIEAMDEYTCGGGAITDQGFMRYVVGPADLPEDADEAKGTMERLMARRAAETRREYYLGCLGGADFIYDATVWELLGLEDLAGPRHRFTD